MPNKHSSLMYRWMEEVWNKGHKKSIDELLHPNAVVHGIDEVNAPGPEGFKAFFTSFRTQFPQLHIEVDDVVSAEDLEFARCTVSGTHATGQQVHFTGMSCIRIHQGRIVEGWNNFDFLTMYKQLGFQLSGGALTTA